MGVSQAEVARRSKVSPQYLNQVISGANENPAVDQLEAIAAALGFTLAELVTTKAERDELADHDLRGCFERVGEVLALARDGHDEQALALLKKRK